jgi:DNA (cytosine-5)-methyltransferase 1
VETLLRRPQTAKKVDLMSKFTFIDLFSGIGGFHLAATANGGECLFSSDIDLAAQKVYQSNYHIKPVGDITKVKSCDIPDHDMLCAGFPCQPFSIMGNRLGFDDMRGTLFYEVTRILKDKKTPLLVLENVKQLSTHDNKRTIARIVESLLSIGYKVFWNVLNALDYGLPQKRERTIIVGFLDADVNFSWPQKIKPYKSLNEILEKIIDSKYFASERIRNKRGESHTSKFYPSIWHENKAGNISSYQYSCALRAGASYNYLLVNGERRLTPREMLRLQGFPDTFKIVCTDSETRKQVGNAVPVPMIEAVIREVLNAATQTEGFKKKSGSRSLSNRRVPLRSHL